MIKLVYCITKKAGLTDEEFFHYWENIHGSIGARIPGLRRLVQSHRVAVPNDSRQPDFDGIAELWFDDMEALQTARSSPQWKTSTEDEANFIDPHKTAYFISHENVIVPGSSEESAEI
ncbi:MAG: EthD domain-containing protein [Candidatus Sulfotelmatobacter sp.]